uniref:Preprotein-translocase subunit g n=1 Tax=Chondria tumulosa TaxID=2740715 RepID=A0A896SQM0_9FLOR|nr:preprotein-translocase subunit g [Chondria tumulosa]QSD57126.1 preprotein-translocase subunit g [Chondria tumulosa]
MIKIFFYLFSFFTIFLILIVNPSKNNVNNFNYQSKILNFRSNQLFLQKLIAFNVVIFFLLIIIFLL